MNSRLFKYIHTALERVNKLISLTQGKLSDLGTKYEKWDNNYGKLKLFILLLVTLMAFYVRYENFLLKNPQFFPNLQPDAVGYYNYALELKISEPYDTHQREPFFIWLTKFFFKITFSNSPDTLRMMTVLLSTLIVPLIYFAGRVFFPAPACILASLFTAFDTAYIYWSPSGLRQELDSILLLLSIIVFFGKFRFKYSQIATGFFGAAAILTRLPHMIWVLPLTYYKGLKDKSRTGILAAFSIILVLVTPHLVHNFRNYGHIFASLPIHIECFGGTGTDKSSTSLSSYICSIRGIKTSISSFINGFFRTFFAKKYAFTHILVGNWLKYIFFITGFIALFFNARYFRLLALIFLASIPTNFIAHMDDIDARMLLHHLVFFNMISAYGIYILLKLFNGGPANNKSVQENL